MSIPHRYVEMVGRIGNCFDYIGPLELALNPRPERCETCSFPNIDHVPKTYRLPFEPPDGCEAWPSVLGNFFVKRRPRAILETVAPGQCRLHPTFHARNLRQTEWWLVCPVLCVPEAQVDPSVPRCPTCREPKTANKQAHFRPIDREPCPFDIFSSREWHSAELTAEEAEMKGSAAGIFRRGEPSSSSSRRWTRLHLDRSLYFSIRMQLLFRHAGVVGIGRAPRERERSATFDRRWVLDKLELLRALNLAEPPPGVKSPETLPAFDTEDLPFLPTTGPKSSLSTGAPALGMG